MLQLAGRWPFSAPLSSLLFLKPPLKGCGEVCANALTEKNEGWAGKAFFPWGECVPPLWIWGVLAAGAGLASPVPAVVVRDPFVGSCPAWVAFRDRDFWSDAHTRDKFSFIFLSPPSLCALFQASKS